MHTGPAADPAGRPEAASLARCGLLLLLAAGPALCPEAAQASDPRHDCRLWATSRGREQVLIANRIGAENLLTKEHNFAVAAPGDRRSLYASSDIRRFCAPF